MELKSDGIHKTPYEITSVTVELVQKTKERRVTGDEGE